LASFVIVRVARYTVNDPQDVIGDCCNSEIRQLAYARPSTSLAPREDKKDVDARESAGMTERGGCCADR
jgi:hypothetical protein